MVNRSEVSRVVYPFGEKMGFMYLPEFISSEREVMLMGWLGKVAIVPYANYDPKRFEFTHMIYEEGDETVEVDRITAATGDPIWWEGSMIAGADIPDVIQPLAEEVSETASLLLHKESTAKRPFTSVYVDGYGKNSFIPLHIDRESYGSEIAAISLGATVEFTFVNEMTGQRLDPIEVEGRSLYIMSGDSRYHPWQHSVDNVGLEVGDVTNFDERIRYSITFRSAEST